MKDIRLLTVYETARKLNSSPSGVKNILASEELETVNKDGCLMVKAESLTEYQKNKKAGLKEITKPLDVRPKYQESESDTRQRSPDQKQQKRIKQKDTEVYEEEWRRRVHKINRQIRDLRNSLQRANTQEVIRELKNERNKILRDNGMKAPGSSRKPFVRFVRSERPQ